ITRIGGVEDPFFEDLMVTVMASESGEKLDFVYRLPGREPVKVEIEPRKESTDLKPMIGISPPSALQFEEKRYYGKSFKQPVWPHSAGARANPPFEFGDRIIATTDPQDPSKVTPLPDDPRKPGGVQRDYFEFSRRMRLLAGRPVTIRVQREVEGKTREVDIQV